MWGGHFITFLCQISKECCVPRITEIGSFLTVMFKKWKVRSGVHLPADFSHRCRHQLSTVVCVQQSATSFSVTRCLPVVLSVVTPACRKSSIQFIHRFSSSFFLLIFLHLASTDTILSVCPHSSVVCPNHFNHIRLIKLLIDICCVHCFWTFLGQFTVSCLILRSPFYWI